MPDELTGAGRGTARRHRPRSAGTARGRPDARPSATPRCARSNRSCCSPNPVRSRTRGSCGRSTPPAPRSSSAGCCFRVRDRLDAAFGDARPTTRSSRCRSTRRGTPTPSAASCASGHTHYDERQRRLYQFRTRHGFTDAGDAAFAALWDGVDLTWADITKLSAAGHTRRSGSAPAPLRPLGASAPASASGSLRLRLVRRLRRDGSACGTVRVAARAACCPSSAVVGWRRPGHRCLLARRFGGSGRHRLPGVHPERTRAGETRRPAEPSADEVRAAPKAPPQPQAERAEAEPRRRPPGADGDRSRPSKQIVGADGVVEVDVGWCGEDATAVFGQLDHHG